MYLFRGIDFASNYDFDHSFWNCSDSIVFLDELQRSCSPAYVLAKGGRAYVSLSSLMR
jgi:hypothetical protein